MSRARLYTSLPLSAFATAFLIGAAPAAWAQCEMGAGAGTTTAQQQGTGGTAAQDDTAMAGDSDIVAGQGGTTTSESGATTAQPGAETTDSGTAAQQGGTTTGTTAALDSPDIEGPDEERIKAMLEEQGYAEVSSIYSCGAYYEAKAMKDGQETTLMVDTSTGRITPQ